MVSQPRKSPTPSIVPRTICAGVALVVLGVPVGSAAHAQPAPDPGTAPTGSAPRVARDVLLPYCFMGRHSWPTVAIGPQPRCEVGR
jgi:hypothetical protein